MAQCYSLGHDTYPGKVAGSYLGATGATLDEVIGWINQYVSICVHVPALPSHQDQQVTMQIYERIPGRSDLYLDEISLLHFLRPCLGLWRG